MAARERTVDEPPAPARTAESVEEVDLAAGEGVAEEPAEGLGDELLESLMDTNLYSMGAFFSDQHPDLVEEVIAWSEAIERDGLRGYADAHGLSVEECFKTLLTGLAVRYYKAVAA
jgi:hypothetical protein